MGHRNIPLSSRYSLSPKDLGPESWPSVRPDDLSTVVCFWNQRQSAAQKGLKASSLWMLKDWLIFSSLEHERSYPQILFSVEDPHVPLILCLGLESEEQVIWKLTRGWGYHQSRNKPETAKKKKKGNCQGWLSCGRGPPISKHRGRLRGHCSLSKKRPQCWVWGLLALVLEWHHCHGIPWDGPGWGEKSSRWPRPSPFCFVP